MKRKKLLLMLGLLAVVGLIAAAVLYSCLRAPKPTKPQHHIIAHRGASGEAPEHTFEAYDLAISYGVDRIEQDVVISQDGTLYVCHDLSAQRLFGDERLFRQMSDEEINALVTADGNKLLTLEEIFDRYKDNKDVIFVVEIKDQVAAEPFLAMVKEKDLQTRCLVQSVNLMVLKTCKTTLPFMHTMYLAKDQVDFNITLSQYYLDILSLPQNLLSRENVEAAHAAGKQFNTWTCNTEEAIRAAIEAGADSYFTDFPGLALELEKELRP